MLDELEQLRLENQALKQRCQDLEASLFTTTEHGDLIEAELHDTNMKLQSEARERMKAETALRSLVELITRQKHDLEIILHTIIEHGDVVDDQWHQKFCEAVLLAGLDGLTQIPNRRRFNDYLEQQWHRLVQEQLPLSLILCDIDHFKLYNDTYGHPAGDICLKRVAHSIQECVLRPSDLVARYGGEEFVAVLPVTDQAGAIAVAERIQQAIARLNIIHDSSPTQSRVTLSIGVASMIPSPGVSPMQLLTLTDQHLYCAKKQGRNQIVCAPLEPTDVGGAIA